MMSPRSYEYRGRVGDAFNRSASSGGDLPEAWAATVQYQSPVSIRELIVSFLRSVERFRLQNERVGDDQLEAESLGFAALAEALNWADSIDNYLRSGPRDTKGTNRDPDWATQLGEDERLLIQAYQRVRNVVHHRWWQVVSTRVFGGVAADHRPRWIWGRLPSQGSDGRGKDAAGNAAYASALEGRDVLVTLDQLATVFWSMRRWQISRGDVTQPGHSVRSPLSFDDEA